MRQAYINPSSPAYKSLPGSVRANGLIGRQFLGSKFDPKAVTGARGLLLGRQFEPATVASVQQVAGRHFVGPKFDMRPAGSKRLLGRQFDPSQVAGAEALVSRYFVAPKFDAARAAGSKGLLGRQFDPVRLAGAQRMVGRNFLGSKFDPSQVAGAKALARGLFIGVMSDPARLAGTKGLLNREIQPARSGLIVPQPRRRLVASGSREVFIAETGTLADELAIAQDPDATEFVWPVDLDPAEFGIALVWLLWGVGSTVYIAAGDEISPLVSTSVGTGHALFVFAWLCRHFLRSD